MLKTITRQLFARLNRHLPYRLVHRDPLPGAQTAVNATIPPSLSERCLKVAAMEQETLWRVFDTHPEGLNAAEVTRAREKHGENRLPAQKPSPWWVHLWVCYRNPFNILLTILGGISYATEDLFAAGVIALMVGISTLLNFVQEARSTKAADALKAMVSNTATVLRVINENGENAWLELPIDQLVPGDIIKLAAGDMIPADLRIIQARDLFVAQASLTARTTLFARLTPMHKERIVTLLKREGHVVGFMGDGINDAPALRAADIGISVDGAVDIAREAADIILLEKSLMVLEEGVIEGRRTFSNMLKYIKMTASSNFGNVFSVLVASAFLPFLPMLPLHLLIQNLLYDVSQVAIPFDNVDEEQIQKPQRWNPADLGRFMVFFGPISSIFDILTFCLMWWVFHANTPETQTLFQSGWFVVGLLSQTLIVHMIRTRRLPFIQSRAAWPLMAMTLLVMVVGVSLPFSPLASYLQLQALPLSYFPWLIAILAGYMTLTQLVKGFYSRRYGWQ
ncbi:magnesium-translocating P-type ATPase [Salmonella enterica]|nr:magnesium-translocating P-type ATPase [Salmonella enterica]